MLLKLTRDSLCFFSIEDFAKFLGLFLCIDIIDIELETHYHEDKTGWPITTELKY